jgi:hypothetical protein
MGQEETYPDEFEVQNGEEWKVENKSKTKK